MHHVVFTGRWYPVITPGVAGDPYTHNRRPLCVCRRQMELAQLPAHCRARACRADSDEYRLRLQRVETMRSQLEETQRRQERERLEEARQRLQQHWRVNNAVLRQVGGQSGHGGWCEGRGDW